MCLYQINVAAFKFTTLVCFPGDFSANVGELVTEQNTEYFSRRVFNEARSW